MHSYFVCFFHFTDFDTCCWVESWKRPSTAGCVPFIVNKNLWKAECLLWFVPQLTIYSKLKNTVSIKASNPTCSSWFLCRASLPWCVWSPELWQAEEKAKLGSLRPLRSLSFRSVPFWVSSTVQGQSVCCDYSTLPAHPLAFYKNVKFLPPHTAAEESPTPPLHSPVQGPYLRGSCSYSTLETSCNMYPIYH